MTSTFDLTQAAELDIELINVLGDTDASGTHAGVKGSNEIKIPLTSAGKGWHLLRIRSKYGTAGIRVLIAD
jgi:hypothetical protein